MALCDLCRLTLRSGEGGEGSTLTILNELPGVVKRQRFEMSLSQERLAELAGLSRATINTLKPSGWTT